MHSTCLASRQTRKPSDLLIDEDVAHFVFACLQSIALLSSPLVLTFRFDARQPLETSFCHFLAPFFASESPARRQGLSVRVVDRKGMPLPSLRLRTLFWLPVGYFINEQVVTVARVRGRCGSCALFRPCELEH